jgi:mannose-6-phosphate isomerase-like protein (cupin superfamily)
VTTIDDPEGGDPACWEHLFADAPDADADTRPVSGLVDLAAVAGAATTPGAAWTHQSEDLNANLLVFPAGEGVAGHVNAEVDVLLVGVAGEGLIDVDGTACVLRPGQALVIPKGARRSTRSLGDPFAYLTCHRRRAGLWPG